MPAGDGSHVGGWLYRWIPVALVLVLLAAAGAAYRFRLGERWFGWELPDPQGNPAAVAPPETLELPEPAGPLPVADAVAGGAVDAAEVRRMLAPLLKDPDLGKHVVALVGTLDSTTTLFSHGSGPVVPASTLKLLTATATLATLGGGATFTTSVVTGRSPREVVLVGGGDPYLASKPVPPAEADATYPPRADVATLAALTADSLRAAGLKRVRVGYDDTLFSGPSASPAWRPDYIADEIVSPITALWVDRGADPSGYGRVEDPSLTAASVFAKALARRGIEVSGAPTPVAAPTGAALLGEVESAPVEQIVQHVLEVSDNEGAEVLAHQVGLAVRDEGSFAGGAAAVVSTLRRLGVAVEGAAIQDGSGLSRKNRVDPGSLLDVLRLAADNAHPELRAVLEGLAVAGFTGSLELRFEDGPAAGRGRVRAKTGTLTGVHGLAGVATDLDGNLMAFVLVADRVAVADTLDAREALDRVAAALGACHCSP